MKDATLYYLNNSTLTLNETHSFGKDYTLFGSGKSDIVFTKSGCFTDIIPQYNSQNILEFRNVTINEGVSILGNNYQASRDFGIAVPFFLKVSGTLTVNGVLNMNGAGQPGYHEGGFHKNKDAAYNISYTTLGYTLPALDVNTLTIPEKTRQDLYNTGLKDTFFNCKTYLIGAGNCRSYRWKGSGLGTKYKSRHAYSTTPLNSGGPFGGEGGKKSSGAGGGFLALYYENMINHGPTWSENGVVYPLNINANGGDASVNGGDGAPTRWGGGMMVIAARKIVIGPNGYICCNPSYSFTRSTGSSPRFGNSELNAGGMALMNRPTTGSYDVMFNYGNIRTRVNNQVGGAGVCFGYQIIPSYTKANH